MTCGADMQRQLHQFAAISLDLVFSARRHRQQP